MTPNTVTHRSKLFLIGIDGATFDIIWPLMNKNKLPHTARLINNGTYGNLYSTIPPVSPVAWTSLMTGKNPGKHGIFDFVRRNSADYTMKFNNASFRKVPPVWKILSDAGKSVGVVNVTMSFPPDGVNGFMLSGLDTPSGESIFSSPPDLGKIIQEKFGRYIFTSPYPFREGVERFITGTHKEIDYRVKTLSYLMDEFSWDFLTVTFIAADGASHFLWKYNDPRHSDYNKNSCKKYGDAIERVYEKLDEAIGELLEKIDDETTVLIVSDHGFGPVYKAVHLNNWLSKNGYLEFDDMKWGKAVNDYKRVMKSTANKILPKKIRGQRRRAKQQELRQASSLSTLEGIKWTKTKAFFNGTVGNIFLNIRGREPLGIVNPGKEAEELCRDIIRKLEYLKDPETGDGIVKKVYKKEDIFSGDHTFLAPELVVLFERGYSVFSNLGNRELNMKIGNRIIIDSYQWSGDHEMNGILIMNGPSIKKNFKLNAANITDITPTILYLQGVPVPEDMDGKVLTDALDSDFVSKNPVRYTEATRTDGPHNNGDVYSDEDSQKIKKMLKGLGYLD